MAGIIGVIFLQMEQIRALCNNIIANVVRHLDPLEGSVHSVVADNVRLELEEGMKDILNTLDGVRRLTQANSKVSNT